MRKESVEGNVTHFGLSIRIYIGKLVREDRDQDSDE